MAKKNLTNRQLDLAVEIILDNIKPVIEEKREKLLKDFDVEKQIKTDKVYKNLLKIDKLKEDRNKIENDIDNIKVEISKQLNCPVWAVPGLKKYKLDFANKKLGIVELSKNDIEKKIILAEDNNLSEIIDSITKSILNKQ